MPEFRAAVITASDKGFAGERQDASGLLVQKILREAGYSIAYYTVLPDDRTMLADTMRRLCDEEIADLILTRAWRNWISGPGMWPEESMKRKPPGASRRGTSRNLSIFCIQNMKPSVVWNPGVPDAVCDWRNEV